MDQTTFHRLVRSFARGSTRRRLVGALSAIPFAGVLPGLTADKVEAEQPQHRLQRRTAQRNRKQRTRKQQNDNGGNNGDNGAKNNKGGGDGDFPIKCGDQICPPEKPLCCAVINNGTPVLACFGGTTCPPPPA